MGVISLQAALRPRRLGASGPEEGRVSGMPPWPQLWCGRAEGRREDISIYLFQRMSTWAGPGCEAWCRHLFALGSYAIYPLTNHQSCIRLRCSTIRRNIFLKIWNRSQQRRRKIWRFQQWLLRTFGQRDTQVIIPEVLSMSRRLSTLAKRVRSDEDANSSSVQGTSEWTSLLWLDHTILLLVHMGPSDVASLV